MGHAVAVTALVVAAEAGSPSWVVLLLGTAVGKFPPQAGALNRARRPAVLVADARLGTG